MVTAYRRALEIQPLADEMSANRIHPLVVTMFPPHRIQGSGEPIDTLAKFDGHLVRSAGSANTLTIEHLGAVGVEMPGADVYVSLERSTINSMLMGVSSIRAYSLQELLKSISSNGQFGSFLTLLAMDEGQWEGPLARDAAGGHGLKR